MYKDNPNTTRIQLGKRGENSRSIGIHPSLSPEQKRTLEKNLPFYIRFGSATPPKGNPYTEATLLSTSEREANVDILSAAAQIAIELGNLGLKTELDSTLYQITSRKDFLFSDAPLPVLIE